MVNGLILKLLTLVLFTAEGIASKDGRQQDEITVDLDGIGDVFDDKFMPKSKGPIMRSERTSQTRTALNMESPSGEDEDEAILAALGLGNEDVESPRGSAHEDRRATTMPKKEENEMQPDIWPWSLDDDKKQRQMRSVTQLSREENHHYSMGSSVQAAGLAEAGTQGCPTEGGYSQWTGWTTCTATCGHGTKGRTREQNNIACVGDTEETLACNTQACPVDCTFKFWTGWGECSLSCGTGTKGRTRGKNGPFFDGVACTGHTTEELACAEFSCPVNCEFEPWSEWGICSKTCQHVDTAVYGTKTRDRGKLGPFHGGSTALPLVPNTQSCDAGHTTETSICNTFACPADCELDGAGTTDWGQWSTCTQTCSVSIVTHGVRKRTRSALPPMNGGKPCAETTQLVHCNTQLCPFDCHYWPWGAWGPCSKSCTPGGGAAGQRYRIRDKVGPAGEGADKGAECPAGNVVEYKNCQDFNCPANCEWNAWGPFNECTKTCGIGGKTRARTKTETGYGGIDCEGPSQHTEMCNAYDCPVDCKWTLWNAWEPCTRTCGKGNARRSRGHDPTSTNGGTHCTGAHMEMITCNNGVCPIDCEYDDWLDWDLCTHSCGHSIQTRARFIKIGAHHGGSDCHADGFSQERVCDQAMGLHFENCPEDCHWGDWGDWSVCDAQCGGSGKSVSNRTLFQAKFGGIHVCPKGDEERDRVCGAENCADGKSGAERLVAVAAPRVLAMFLLAQYL